jgi:uncharacterized membrane protein
MSKNSSSNNGIGVLGLLGVAFVVLKLTGFIDWSWWFVTLPFWGVLALLVVILAIYLLYHLVKSKTKAKRFSKKTTPIRKSRFQQKLDEAIEKSKLNNSNASH